MTTHFKSIEKIVGSVSSEILKCVIYHNGDFLDAMRLNLNKEMVLPWIKVHLSFLRIQTCIFE